ncbi:TetR/AcrR family transcriptional regulator [Frisingicoccus caecimuris]|nr:TetR/AcrR family transcriptional regulator [Frisingicoccus caecimuris]MCR1919696.1 TetR/AcrR family transcriptional regulator [Frisingicoccus caecimuris]
MGMDGHKKQREQSARMIETALFELMEEKAFNEITVSEIVKRADVARRTFYRLYNRKEDVIHRYFGKLSRDYGNTYPALDKYDLKQIGSDYFKFWYQHREFLLLMNQSGLGEMIYYEISRASEEIVKKRIGCEKVRNGQDVRFFAYYSTGGFILLLHHWIIDGMKETPEQYAQQVSRAILKCTEACGLNRY